MTRAAGRVLLAAGAATSAILLPLAPGAAAQIIEPCPPRAFVFLVPGASFEDLLAVPEVGALSRSGGAALMRLEGGLPTRAEDLPNTCEVSWRWLPARGPGGLAGVGHEIQRLVLASGSDPALVFVASTTSSPQMEAAKDDVHPLVMARGAPALLFRQGGSARVLASDTTRRTGVVTDRDVRASILQFMGRRVPSSVEGLPLRVVDDDPPFDLHARYLQMRRLSVPIQTAAGLYVTVGGLFGLTLIALGRRVRPALRRAGAGVAMSVPALATSLLAVGHLPTLSYATVVPFVVLVTVAATVGVAPLARRDALLPPAALGTAVLAYFAIEALLGWTAALTPLLGGSELDGGRFFGLPNVFLGLLIGASLYLASRMEAGPGFALVVAVALFAGLPSAGANLGGSVSLFAAAGLWLAVRSRGRLDWPGLAIAAGVVLVGAAVVLLAHRFLTSTPTHVTRFEELAGRDVGDVWRTFVHRLSTGWHLIERNPFALVPVVGLPLTAAAVLRPPAPVAAAFGRHPVWRDVLLVTLLGGIAAYVANDTGPAAAGLAFGLALGGLVYVALIEGTGKMEAP